LDAEQKPLGEIAIRFLSGPLAEKIIYIQKPVTTIGRDKQNDIIVFDQRVSRRHACIRQLNGSWIIENLSQSSYVAINQQRTPQGILQHNSVVSLGDNISFVFLVRQPVAQPAQQTIPAVEPWELPINVTPVATATRTVLTPRPEIGMPSLTVSSNIHSDQQVHILNKQILNIGRDPENDIAIAEPKIGRAHV